MKLARDIPLATESAFLSRHGLIPLDERWHKAMLRTAAFLATRDFSAFQRELREIVCKGIGGVVEEDPELLLLSGDRPGWLGPDEEHGGRVVQNRDEWERLRESSSPEEERDEMGAHFGTARKIRGEFGERANYNSYLFVPVLAHRSLAIDGALRRGTFTGGLRDAIVALVRTATLVHWRSAHRVTEAMVAARPAQDPRREEKLTVLAAGAPGGPLSYAEALQALEAATPESLGEVHDLAARLRQWFLFLAAERLGRAEDFPWPQPAPGENAPWTVALVSRERWRQQALQAALDWGWNDLEPRRRYGVEEPDELACLWESPADRRLVILLDAEAAVGEWVNELLALCDRRRAVPDVVVLGPPAHDTSRLEVEKLGLRWEEIDWGAAEHELRYTVRAIARRTWREVHDEQADALAAIGWLLQGSADVAIRQRGAAMTRVADALRRGRVNVELMSVRHRLLSELEEVFRHRVTCAEPGAGAGGTRR